MGKTVSHVILGLKTAKGTKQLKLDPTIYDALQKEKVLAGDVIYVEANSGRCVVVGGVLVMLVVCCVCVCVGIAGGGVCTPYTPTPHTPPPTPTQVQ